MELSERAGGDLGFGDGGALVLVDPESAAYLDGCTLDFSQDLTSGGFKIVNPRAARSCGCGTSFEPAETSA